MNVHGQNKKDTTDPTSSARMMTLDRFFRYIVLPLVLVSGIYGLVRYVLIGS